MEITITVETQNPYAKKLLASMLATYVELAYAYSTTLQKTLETKIKIDIDIKGLPEIT